MPEHSAVDLRIEVPGLVDVRLRGRARHREAELSVSSQRIRFVGIGIRDRHVVDVEGPRRLLGFRSEAVIDPLAALLVRRERHHDLLRSRGDVRENVPAGDAQKISIALDLAESKRVRDALIQVHVDEEIEGFVRGVENPDFIERNGIRSARHQRRQVERGSCSLGNDQSRAVQRPGIAERERAASERHVGFAVLRGSL